eukprot:scaffold133146_cov28-Tisochrysis_lutea.AAC.1
MNLSIRIEMLVSLKIGDKLSLSPPTDDALPGGVGEGASTMPLVLEPLARIRNAVRPNTTPNAASLAIAPLALVLLAAHVHAHSKSTSQACSP